MQKHQQISREAYSLLKKNRLVEGRYPNIFVAAKIAAITGDRSSYIKYRAFDKAHYKKMIIGFITQFGAASRKDIDSLLMSKLPDILDEKQKSRKINNLLNEMSKKDGSIKNIGTRKKPKWVLT